MRDDADRILKDDYMPTDRDCVKEGRSDSIGMQEFWLFPECIQMCVISPGAGNRVDWKWHPAANHFDFMFFVVDLVYCIDEDKFTEQMKAFRFALRTWGRPGFTVIFSNLAAFEIASSQRRRDALDSDDSWPCAWAHDLIRENFREVAATKELEDNLRVEFLEGLDTKDLLQVMRASIVAEAKRERG